MSDFIHGKIAIFLFIPLHPMNYVTCHFQFRNKMQLWKNAKHGEWEHDVNEEGVV